MIKIDCKRYADEILEQVAQIPDKKKGLVILTAGDDPASAAYMKGKTADCERCGIRATQVKAESYDELIAQIWAANRDSSVSGIIIQLPLPAGFNDAVAVNMVSGYKDVDGFQPGSPFLPCTPEGILYVLDKEIGDLAGKKVLLIGKGKLVGKPLIDLLLDRGCTLTIAHSRSDLHAELTEYHDVVITAVGKPRLVNLKIVDAKVVIDAGISRDEDGKLGGDCYNFDPFFAPWMRVTTVPGGVGLMTRAMLMKHMGEVNR